MSVRAIGCIARSVLIEAVRRKEVYVVVLVSTIVIGGAMTLNFFEVEGLTKFYREIALKTMSVATALTVIVLASRQLPREFENRTIYPLLARPISRGEFLTGKLVGVLLAGGFCLGLFMAVYLTGSLYLGGAIPWLLFGQYIYLQVVMLTILATLCFWLSMVFNLDAAIAIGALCYIFASLLTSVSIYIYDFAGTIGQWALKAFTFLLPQLVLFDLSGKAVHADLWPPLSASVMTQLTLYGATFAVVYYAMAALCFRRKTL